MFKKKFSTLFLVSLISSGNISANEGKMARPINLTMSELGQTIALLSPEMFEDTSIDDDGSIELKNSITKLVHLFHEAEPHFNQSSVAYQISYDVMKQHMEDINTVIKQGDFKLARGMLRTVPQLCMGCHTQDGHEKKLFINVKPNYFKNEFHFAEFSFITRDYDSALKHYERYLDELKDIEQEHIEVSLKRILVIYTQIRKQPKEGIKFLNHFINNNTIPKPTRQMINEWIIGLKELSTTSVVDQHSLKQRHDYIDYYLGQLKNHSVNYFASEKDKVFYLTLRGLLYEYLTDNPPVDDIPMVLYWLAVCDRTLEYSFYDNLSDLYLKECILTYPSHPYAKKCFKEYESYVRFAFTGSGGTHLPTDLDNEIRFLKSLVTQASTKKLDVKPLAPKTVIQ